MKAKTAAFHHPGEELEQPATSFLQRLLEGVEKVGNKVPHPVVIFVLLILAVIVLSHIFYMFGAAATYETINPDTHAAEKVTTTVESLLTPEGIRFMYSKVIPNFMSFTAT